MRTSGKFVDQEEFLQNLKMVLKKNPELRAAWQRARRGGCTDVNLLTFLYAYNAGEELVMRPRRKNRKRILATLSSLAKRLESAATDVDRFLNFRWWKDQLVSELLSGLNIELEAEQASVILNGVESFLPSGPIKARGKLRPDFMLELAQNLRVASQMLELLHTGLGKKKGWDERSVGRTLYLADLVLYWQGVSGKSPAWKDVAALVEGARIAAGSRGRFSDETVLRLNVENFKKRNPAMCSDFETSLAEYLQSGDPSMSFYKWSRQSKRTP